MWAKTILTLVVFLAVICGALLSLRAYKRASESKRLANRASQTRTQAEQGDVKSERLLGSMYYYGRGVPQDYAQAAQWFRNAADQGDAEAEYDLSFMYYGGKGVPLDYTTGVLWCRKSADQGFAKAEAGLGNTYRRGLGVPQDYDEAIRWYRKAADQNDPSAESALGYMYHHGQGIPQDDYEAVRWYRRAATHGDAEAQRFIAAHDGRRGPPKWRYVSLFVLFVGGSLFTFDFLLRGRNIRTRKQIAVTISGILSLSYVGLSLYGITHEGAWYFVHFNVFWWAKRLLAGCTVLLLLSVVLESRKKQNLSA
jgi:tetratricopeptide (TPR) repeat protein